MISEGLGKDYRQNFRGGGLFGTKAFYGATKGGINWKNLFYMVLICGIYLISGIFQLPHSLASRWDRKIQSSLLLDFWR